MSIKLSGEKPPIGREKSAENREYNENPFVPMKKSLILSVTITVKMIVYGPLIERKKIGEVEKTSTNVSTKSYGMVSRMFRGRCAPCSFFLKKTLSIIIVTSKKYCLLLYDTETVNLETTTPFNKTTEQHIPIKKRKTVVASIFHHLLTRIHDRRIVPI